MKPISFAEKTKTLSKPADMTDEECSSLDIFSNGKVCISRWKASIWERIIFFFTGKVWISIHSGHTQPPVLLLITSPFEKVKKK